MRWAGLAVVLAGCISAPRTKYDARDLDRGLLERDFGDVSARATLELRCPREQLKLTVLSTYLMNDGAAATISAAGCGKQIIYVRGSNVWVRDSEVLPWEPPASDGGS